MSQPDDRPLPVVQSPLCERIRSKKYFFLETLPTCEDDINDASNHCWCSETMHAVGPDGYVVNAEHCKASRECYVSAL